MLDGQEQPERHNNVFWTVKNVVLEFGILKERIRKKRAAEFDFYLFSSLNPPDPPPPC